MSQMVRHSDSLEFFGDADIVQVELHSLSLPLHLEHFLVLLLAFHSLVLVKTKITAGVCVQIDIFNLFISHIIHQAKEELFSYAQPTVFRVKRK